MLLTAQLIFTLQVKSLMCMLQSKIVQFPISLCFTYIITLSKISELNTPKGGKSKTEPQNTYSALLLSALSFWWNTLSVVLHHVYCIKKQVTKIMKLNIYAVSITTLKSHIQYVWVSYHKKFKLVTSNWTPI